MKLGLFTSGYQRNSIEDMFADAKRFGYDYIELWGGRPHAFPPDLKRFGVQELRRLMDRYDMPVPIFTPETNAYPYNFMLGNEAQRKDSVDYICLCMDMAVQLGCQATLISAAHAGYRVDQAEIWDRLLRSLAQLTSYAEKLGHKLILEPLTPYESNVVTTVNDLQRVFEALPSPALVGMCDVVPPFVQHESILDYFDKLGSKLYHMHIVDSYDNSDTHLIPGEGSLPLPELMAELRERGYQGTATIELVTNYLNEPRLYARRAIQRLRTMEEEY
ncbi:fructoselysine 3-epimerase [Flavonifractor sp. HCP28S3_F3]|uniref:fructoselysine 3-epimerase n=1 Tax=Flavonifractor sp. HCP28S3_F3 TaxID=3438939 RepID=UPI003F8869A1